MAAASEYPIAQSTSEWQRLQSQHELWIRNIGYHIHPHFEKLLGDTPCIADIGTGTGNYLIDLARKFPTSPRLDGFDISNAQFRSDTAPNIKFRVHDTKKPFPPEFHAQYDFVHIRLLITAMEKDDWSTIVANTVQLLKPGGVLQWVEPASMNAMVLRGRSVILPRALNTINEYFKMGLRHRLKQDHLDLPAIFAAHGLVDVTQDIVASDNDATTRAAVTSITYGGYSAYMRYLHDQKASGAWTLAQIDSTRQDWQKEIADGAYLRFDIYITVGIKGDKHLE